MLALLSFRCRGAEYRVAAASYIWSAAYVAFAALCLLAAWVSRTSQTITRCPSLPAPAAEGSAVSRGRPTIGQLALWISLAACASTLLVSITNHMSQNVADPLLWVVPLAIYLLTFILAFESDKIYQRWIFLLGRAGSGLMAYALYAGEEISTSSIRFPSSARTVICCMLCHGELALHKPAPQYLTLSTLWCP
jgi:hypothetical protein